MATHSSRVTRSKKAAVKKKPSSTSLFSNLTKASKSSSGSNSTVTQESVSRPKQRSSKQGTAEKAASSRPSNRKSSSKSAPSVPTIQEKVDVFQYLEEEDGEAERNDAAELEGADIPHPTRLETASMSSSSSREHLYPSGYQNYHNEYNQHWANRRMTMGSLHSDSGISVRSSSPERDSLGVLHNTRSGRGSLKVKVESMEACQELAPTSVTSPRVLAPFNESPDMSPEAFYSAASRPNFQQTEYESEDGHLPSYRDSDLADETGEQDMNASEESPKSSYDVLAFNLTSSSNSALMPIYRKFEKLNNRVLLHLQDEIMGLENYLEQLDKAVVGLGKECGIKIASSQDESSTPGDVKCQRATLVDRISAKLDQYNRTLSLYSSLSRHLDTVSPTTVNVYKEWLKHHPLTDDIETSFLDHDTDLIAIPKHHGSTVSAMDRSAIVTGFALLMTVMAFKIIAQLASRLLVGTIIALAMAYSGSSVTFDFNYLQEHMKRAAAYGAVIMLLAVAVG